MQVYDNLLEEVNKYVEKEPVEDTEDVVSLYTLWNALKFEADKLTYVYNDNGDLVEFANYIYKDAFRNPDLYEAATENLGFKIPYFRPIQFSKVRAVCTSDSARFYFYLAGRRNNFCHNCIDVNRDLFDDSYYGDNINSFLVRNCKPLLDAKFEFMKFYAEIPHSYGEQHIKANPFDITISHYSEDNPKLFVSLDKNVDPNGSQYKNYYDKDKTIDEIVSSLRDKILLVTPVAVSSLNSYCSEVLNRYRNEKDMSPIGFGLSTKESDTINENTPKQLKKNRNN